MDPANERRCYNITFLIGWTHTQNDLCKQMPNRITVRLLYELKDIVVYLPHIDLYCTGHFLINLLLFVWYIGRYKNGRPIYWHYTVEELYSTPA